MRMFLLLAAMIAAPIAVPAWADDARPLVSETDATVAEARKVMMGNPDQAYALGRRLERIARASNDETDRDIALSRAYWISGEASTRVHQYGRARRLIDAAYGLAVSGGSAKAQADALLSSGSLRQTQGELAGALNDYLASMRLFQTIRDARSQAVALQYLGDLYMLAADYSRAERYYTEAGETYSSEPRITLALQNNLGNLKMDSRDYGAATTHYHRAAEIARKLGDEPTLSFVLDNEARALTAHGRLTQAATTMLRVERLAASHGLSQDQDLVTTRGEIALATGRLDDARRYVEQVLATGHGDTNAPSSIDINDLAYRVYKARGEYGRALPHLEKVRRTRDGLTALAISTKTTLMAAQFDFASQELRIARMKANDMRRNMADERAVIRQQRTIFMLVGVGLLVLMSVLCFVVVLIRRSRDSAREANAALTKALKEAGQREIAEQKATQRAEHDALTGLPNRRHLYDRLYSQMEGQRVSDEQCSVMLLDLDRFKPINDVHGHDVGDAVLIQVAERLQAIANRHAAKAIRLGGDEFMLVMTSARGDEAAARVAREIIDEVSAPYEVGEKRLAIGTSIGISRNPYDGKTVDDLLRAADIAMYEAKNSGRKSFRFFDEAMVIKLRDREEIESDLRAAIATDGITAVFQPLHCYSDDRISGFEALARWHHPTRGAVAPDDFIPVAEDAGLIDEITASMVRQACRAAREWPDDVTVAINLSPCLLRDSWIVARIFGILSSEGLPPRRLIIEITENAVIDDIERAGEVIDAFRTAGIRVALDDFGKGYSSLSHLRQLSFDFLKLDASFVRTLGEDDSLKIATAVAGLGRALNLPVTAEGVETAHDAAVIRDLGFSYAQGYHYGRPMTRDDARTAAWPMPHDEAIPALLGVA
jgi:diguanylate cyclase (GGDEF)-like protein